MCVVGGENTQVQIASDRRSKCAWPDCISSFCVFHSFLADVQTKLATCVPCTHKSSLEIGIVGSTCCLPLLRIMSVF